MMTSMEWLFWNIDNDRDVIFKPGLIIYFRLRSGKWVSHPVTSVSLGENIDWVCFHVKLMRNIPEFIALAIRCYDPEFYQRLHKPSYLEVGETFDYKLTLGRIETKGRVNDPIT